MALPAVQEAQDGNHLQCVPVKTAQGPIESEEDMPLSEDEIRPLESAATAEISTALAAAQAEIEPPTKDRKAQIKSEKGTYSYSYVDLSAIIECLRGPFTKHGLSQSQAMVPTDGHILLITTIRHKSGEWIRSYYPIGLYQRPQEQGSAISYARRYALQALAGVMAEDDDDGERAQHATPTQPQKQQAPPPKPSGDAQAILDLALKISAETGESVETTIKDASRFEVDGKEKWFTDPAKVSSLKWLGKTRRNLEETLKYNSSPPQLDSADPDDVVPF